jgi:hypothetical protein
MRPSRLLKTAHLLQRGLLHLAWGWFTVTTRRAHRNSIDWVVGTDEVASMIHNISSALPNAESVSLSTHPFYTFQYDHELRQGGSPRIRALRRIVVAPVMLARLAVRARGFLYVGPGGFLNPAIDDRRSEFAFLAARGRRICCYWTGSDIRSIRLMHELEDELGRPNIATVIGVDNPVFESAEHDDRVRRRAAVSDEFADIIFNVSVDQRSYLRRHTEPFQYFYPDEDFVSGAPVSTGTRVVVAHAPSSPVIKGTALVREAVARLHNEGYDFDYEELIGLPHESILAQLRRSDIVANQFYAFVPSVFGIEALASWTAVLMSADPTVEPDIAPGSDGAWLVTGPTEVYDNLKRLLDQPETVSALAARGYDWARATASASASGRALQRLLATVLDGDYPHLAKLPPQRN